MLTGRKHDSATQRPKKSTLAKATVTSSTWDHWKRVKMMQIMECIFDGFSVMFRLMYYMLLSAVQIVDGLRGGLMNLIVLRV